MESREQRLIVVGGPNGAGKTTFAKRYAAELGIPYLGADEIATKLSPGDPTSVRVGAAVEFLNQLQKTLLQGSSVIIESTLAGRTLRRRLRAAQTEGYRSELVFVFLESAEACIDRVRARVRLGGHDVPEGDIRRRYTRSIVNFWNRYRGMSDQWMLVNNSGRVPVDVALGAGDNLTVRDSVLFERFKATVDQACGQ